MHSEAQLPTGVKLLASAALLAAFLCLPACTVKTDKSGGDKNVKIDTPVGDLHVTTEADAKDVGLSVFPGAQPKQKSKEDSNTAKVNISTGLFGLRVVALEYTTDAPPDKVTAFYKQELSKYGTIVECPGSKATVSLSIGNDKDSGDRLGCDKDHSAADSVEYKAGSKDNQHIVSIKPAGKGSEFTLVYVGTRGKDKGAL